MTKHRLEVFGELSDTFQSLIPLKGKRPIWKDWTFYCENSEFYDPKKFKGCNAGIPGGPANDVIILDVDDQELFDAWLKEKGFEWPTETRTHQTGSGKFHYFYQYPADGKKYGRRSLQKSAGIDIMGIGGQVVAPGSVHPGTDKHYSVFLEFDIAPAPQWILDLTLKDKSLKSADPERVASLPSKEFPPCIKYILSKVPQCESTTNLVVTNIAAYFQAAGYSLDDAITEADFFIINYGYSKSYPLPADRRKHFEAQWEYVLKTPKFQGVSCSFWRGQGLPGSAFECSVCEPIAPAIDGEYRGEAKRLNDTAAKKGTPIDNVVPINQEVMETNDPVKVTAPEEILSAEAGLIKEDELKQKGPPPFPDVISGVAGEVVEVFKRYLEAPEQFIYMGFITFLGAALARMVTLDTAVKVQTRFYTILIGPSGVSRKTTIIAQLVELFRSLFVKNYPKGINSEDFKLDICAGVGSDVGLARRMEKSKSLILAIDEFRSLTSKAGIKNSALLPTIATLFDRNEFSNYVKAEKDSFDIEDGYLSMIAACTPETFEEIWKPEFTNIGLNNRLFICPGEGIKKGLPPKIPPSELNSLRMSIGKVVGIVGGNVELVFSDDALFTYNNWYEGLEASVHSTRLESYCLRLVCIMAVNELKVVIDNDIIQKAICLCNWQLAMRKLYDPVGGDNTVANLEEKIRRQLEIRGPMKKRKLIQFTNARRSGLYFFDNALKNLDKAGDILLNKKSQLYRLRA